MKFATEIVKEIKERGSVNVPKGYVTGEPFEAWLCERRNYVDSDKCRSRT